MDWIVWVTIIALVLCLVGLAWTMYRLRKLNHDIIEYRIYDNGMTEVAYGDGDTYQIVKNPSEYYQVYQNDNPASRREFRKVVFALEHVKELRRVNH